MLIKFVILFTVAGAKLHIFLHITKLKVKKMVFAAENRRLYGGFGGRKFPIAGIKKFPNVPEIKIERSKIKN